MGSVQATIDWRTATPEELDGHRCIITTVDGTIIDGYLKAIPPFTPEYQLTRFVLHDRDLCRTTAHPVPQPQTRHCNPPTTHPQPDRHPTNQTTNQRKESAMNNADITSLIHQALAADCQITITLTPKNYITDDQAETEDKQ